MTLRPLIFTDLDGTLLDHYSYSFEPARPQLERLQQRQIPVIPATSKTRAELLPLRQQLQLQTPFMVENGAAVFIPDEYALPATELVTLDGFRVKEFVDPRQHWSRLVDELPPFLQEHFTTFSRLGVTGVAELTGLGAKSAALACQRQYGEPVHWSGDDALKTQFIAEVEQRGGRALQGGRFIHISGHCSKAAAMNWLANCYRQQGEQVVTIAAGDSENDREMLEQADIALVIPSPVHAPLELGRSGETVVARQPGPQGWATEIELIVESITSATLK
ncbi:MAG: HAD-IIB family hydrolase [Gammaproteobacteria bacterium]